MAANRTGAVGTKFSSFCDGTMDRSEGSKAMTKKKYYNIQWLIKLLILNICDLRIDIKKKWTFLGSSFFWTSSIIEPIDLFFVLIKKRLLI